MGTNHSEHSASTSAASSNFEVDECRAAIICVDDEPTILSSLGEQLKRSVGQHYDIELVDSGAEAIALCAELTAEGIKIPLVISDQIMPEMMGDRLLIELHQLYPDTLKILLTGQANADAVGNLVNASALYRYVAKPWEETDLILTVEEALRRYQQEQQLAEQNKVLIEVNQQLACALSLLQATLEATADGILVLSNSGRVVNYNQKFVDIWGLTDAAQPNPDRTIPLSLDKLNRADASHLQKLCDSVDLERYSYLELTNGKILECYSQIQQFQSQKMGQVWSFRDVTEYQKAQEVVRHQAFHDSLTNLPNRALFDRRLAAAIEWAESQAQMLAVAFLDLDYFKTVNDTLGHGVGDLLLQNVVGRLQNCLRQDDTLARWGGDEFTLLLPKIDSQAQVSKIFDRILTSLKPEFILEGHKLQITCSIGIALFPDGGKDASTLLKHADIALYWVKEQGRNSYQYYVGG